MIYLLIGVPGSGKSTYAKKLHADLGIEIISTDQTRNLHPDWSEDLIWPEVYRLVAEAVKEDRDVVFDATNATPKVRARFRSEVEKHNVTPEIVALYFDTPWEECQRRVIKRNQNPAERYLPPEVVASYGHSIIKPSLEEGFVAIQIIQNGIVVETIK